MKRDTLQKLTECVTPHLARLKDAEDRLKEITCLSYHSNSDFRYVMALIKDPDERDSEVQTALKDWMAGRVKTQIVHMTETLESISLNDGLPAKTEPLRRACEDNLMGAVMRKHSFDADHDKTYNLWQCISSYDCTEATAELKNIGTGEVQTLTYKELAEQGWERMDYASKPSSWLPCYTEESEDEKV